MFDFDPDYNVDGKDGLIELELDDLHGMSSLIIANDEAAPADEVVLQLPRLDSRVSWKWDIITELKGSAASLVIKTYNKLRVLHGLLGGNFTSVDVREEEDADNVSDLSNPPNQNIEYSVSDWRRFIQEESREIEYHFDQDKESLVLSSFRNDRCIGTIPDLIGALEENKFLSLSDEVVDFLVLKLKSAEVTVEVKCNVVSLLSAASAKSGKVASVLIDALAEASDNMESVSVLYLKSLVGPVAKINSTDLSLTSKQLTTLAKLLFSNSYNLLALNAFGKILDKIPIGEYKKINFSCDIASSDEEVVEGSGSQAIEENLSLKVANQMLRLLSDERVVHPIIILKIIELSYFCAIKVASQNIDSSEDLLKEQYGLWNKIFGISAEKLRAHIPSNSHHRFVNMLAHMASKLAKHYNIAELQDEEGLFSDSFIELVWRTWQNTDSWHQKLVYVDRIANIVEHGKVFLSEDILFGLLAQELERGDNICKAKILKIAAKHLELCEFEDERIELIYRRLSSIKSNLDVGDSQYPSITGIMSDYLIRQITNDQNLSAEHLSAFAKEDINLLITKYFAKSPEALLGLIDRLLFNDSDNITISDFTAEELDELFSKIIDLKQDKLKTLQFFERILTDCPDYLLPSHLSHWLFDILLKESNESLRSQSLSIISNRQSIENLTALKESIIEQERIAAEIKEQFASGSASWQSLSGHFSSIQSIINDGGEITISLLLALIQVLDSNMADAVKAEVKNIFVLLSSEGVNLPSFIVSRLGPEIIAANNMAANASVLSTDAIFSEISRTNSEDSPLAESQLSVLRARLMQVIDYSASPSNLVDIEGRITDFTEEDILEYGRLFKVGYESFDDKETAIIELVAVINQASILHHGYGLRQVQLLSLLTMLLNHEGTLLQVSTGEGKSIITASLAICFAMQGKMVDIITSSGPLAERDQQEKAEFIAMFGICSDNNCASYQGDDTRECYSAEIVYGSISSFQFDLLRDEYRGKNIRGNRPFDIILVDEVDSMMIDESSNLTMMSGNISGIEYLYPILTSIWLDLKNLQEGRIVHLATGAVFVHGAYQVIDGEVHFTDEEAGEIYPVENEYLFKKMFLRQSLIEKLSRDNIHVPRYFFNDPNNLSNSELLQIDLWVESALRTLGMELGRDYVIEQEEGGREVIKPVSYASTGVIHDNMHWSHGLHQFLQMKHNLALQAENSTTSFFSNFGYIKKYGTNIYGMSGTLGDIDTQNMIKTLYGLQLGFIPRYKQRDFIENEATICSTQDEWLNSVVGQTQTMTSGDSARSVLIICNSINKVDLIEAALRAVGINPKIYTRSGGDEGNVTRETLMPGEVVVATNLAGRGTDFKVSRILNNNGGLHVIVTFLPENQRVEDQAYGRTSRSGNPGSAEMVINHYESCRELGYDTISHIDSSIEKLKQLRDEVHRVSLLNVLFYQAAHLEIKDQLFGVICQVMQHYRVAGYNDHQIEAIEELWNQELKELERLFDTSRAIEDINAMVKSYGLVADNGGAEIDSLFVALSQQLLEFFGASQEIGGFSLTSDKIKRIAILAMLNEFYSQHKSAPTADEINILREVLEEAQLELASSRDDNINEFESREPDAATDNTEEFLVPNAFNQRNNPSYWLQATDIEFISQVLKEGFAARDIAMFKSADNANLASILGAMREAVSGGKIAVTVANQNNSHWVVFAMVKRAEQYYIFFKDSYGRDALRELIISCQPDIEFVANSGNEQGIDTSHCGIFALKNMGILSDYLYDLREASDESFDNFKERFRNDNMHFCSLDDARALRRGHFADCFVQGAYEGYFAEQLIAEYYRVIRENHYDELGALQQYILDNSSYACEIVDGIGHNDPGPNAAKIYIEVASIRGQIFRNHATNQITGYGYGYRLSWDIVRGEEEAFFTWLQSHFNQNRIYYTNTTIGPHLSALIVLPTEQIETCPQINLNNIQYDREANPVSLRELLFGQISCHEIDLAVNILTSSNKIHFIDDITESEPASPVSEEQNEELNNEQQKSSSSAESDIPGAEENILAPNAYNQRNNPNYLLQATDIEFISRIVQESYIDDSGIEIFKSLSDEGLNDILASMYQSATNGNIALAIASQNVSHWVSFAMVKHGEQIYVFYKDSRGQDELKDAIISNYPDIEFIANALNEQGSDDYHGGIFALRNMIILAEYLQEVRDLGAEEFRDFKHNYAALDMCFCSLADARADRSTIIAEYFIQGLYENYFIELLKAKQDESGCSFGLANILYDREANPSSLKSLLAGAISLDEVSRIVEILQNSGRVYFVDDTALAEPKQTSTTEKQRPEPAAPASEEQNEEQQREKVGKAKTKLTSLEKELANLVSSNSFTGFVNSKGDHDILQMLSRVFGLNIILFKDKNSFVIKYSDDLANTPLILLASTPADKHHNLRYFALKEASAYNKEHQAVLLSLLKSAPINQEYNKAISQKGFSHFSNVNDEKVTNAIRIYTVLQYHKAVAQNKLRGEAIVEHFNEWRSKTEKKAGGGANNSNVISNPSSLVQRANKISVERNYDKAISLYNEAIAKEDYYNAIARYMKAYNIIQKGARECRAKKEAETGYINDAFEELAKTFHEIENIHKVSIQSMFANLAQVENADNQQKVKLTQLMEQLQAKMKFLCEWQKNINTIMEQGSIKHDEKDTYIEVSRQISSVELNSEGHKKYKIGSEYINKGLDFTFEVKKEKIVRDTDWWAVGFLTAMAVFQGIVGFMLASTGFVSLGASFMTGAVNDIWKAFKVGTGQEQFNAKNYFTSKGIELAINLGTYACLSSMGLVSVAKGTPSDLVKAAIVLTATNIVTSTVIDWASTELAKDLVHKFKEEIGKKVDKAVDQLFDDYDEKISILLIDDMQNFSVKNRVAVNKALTEALNKKASEFWQICKGILHKAAGSNKSIALSLISGATKLGEIIHEINQTDEIIRKVIKKVGESIENRASNKTVKAEDLQNIDVSAKKEEWKGSFKLTLKKAMKSHLENSVIKPMTDVVCANVIPNIMEITKEAIQEFHKLYAEHQQAKQKREQEALDLHAKINGNERQGYMQMAPTPKPKLAERGTFQKQKLEERQAAGENMARGGYRLDHIKQATAMPGSVSSVPSGMGDKPTAKPTPYFSRQEAPEHLSFDARPEEGTSHSQLPHIDLDIASMPMSAFMPPADKTVPIFDISGGGNQDGSSSRPNILTHAMQNHIGLGNTMTDRGLPNTNMPISFVPQAEASFVAAGAAGGSIELPLAQTSLAGLAYKGWKYAKPTLKKHPVTSFVVGASCLAYSGDYSPGNIIYNLIPYADTFYDSYSYLSGTGSEDSVQARNVNITSIPPFKSPEDYIISTPMPKPQELGPTGGGFQIWEDYNSEPVGCGGIEIPESKGPEIVGGGFPIPEERGPLVFTKDIPGIDKINGRNPINADKFAGQDYPLPPELAKQYPEGVKFDDKGFARFEPHTYVDSEGTVYKVKLDCLTGDQRIDSKLANTKIGKKLPKTHTWHHVEDGKTMIGVPEELHETVRHTGGRAKIKEITKQNRGK